MPSASATDQFRNRKTIRYYRKHVYGKALEYVADEGDAKIIAQLTGKATIDGVTRELIRDLTCGMVGWQEVMMP